MDWLRGRLKQLRAVFRKEVVERELSEEVRFHLEMEAEKNIGLGMDPAEARRRALIAFGGVERYAEEVRGARWTRWYEDVGRDVRYAARMLARKPAFTAVAMATLALGIGATTVMFGVVDALFLSPPPGVREADELVRIYIARDEGRITTGPGGGNGSYPDYVAMREGGRGFRDIAAFDQPGTVDLDVGPDARRITGQVVTENFFHLLGVRPLLGRFFVESDADAAADPMVVISHAFWRRHFAGEQGAVGSTLLLNGATVTVIGVAPPRFTGIEPEPVDVWVPAASASALGIMFEGWRTNALSLVIGYIGRLEPGASAEAAVASVEAALRHAAEAVDGIDPDPKVIAGPFITARGPKRSAPASVAIWVAFAAGLLLLISCANVANLLLARAATRRREIAVRLSLGVRRGRLVQQLLTEGLLVALLGCLGGVALALLGTAVATQFPLPPAAGRLNGRMLAFAGAAAVLTGTLFGLVPALQALRIDTVAGLKDSARTHSPGRGRLRAGLVGAQAALALVALTGAGLFLRSLGSALSIDAGFDFGRVEVVTVDLGNAGYRAAEQDAFVSRARERLLAMPGVLGVTTTRIMPLSGAGYLLPVDPPEPESRSDTGDRAYANWVTPGFERTMGIEVVSGRALSEADREGSPPVAVISTDLAQVLAPGRPAVGLCVPVGNQREEGGCTRIVGVVESIRHVLLGEPTPYIFLPWAQHPKATRWGPVRLYVRTDRRAEGLTRQIQAAVQGLAPDLPYVSVEPMASTVHDDLLPFRIGAQLSTLFGILALTLAAIGLYGVLAYFVAERTPEIGIRRSLGARDGDVVRLVLRQGAIPVVAGIALGIVAALAGAGLLEALLFGVSARDPFTFGAVAFFLGVVALLASYLPARRALRVDPRIALREG